MKATTDLRRRSQIDAENKPGVSNLLNIYSVLTASPLPNWKPCTRAGAATSKRSGGSDRRVACADQKRYEAIRNSEELLTILNDGAEKADAIAQKTMQRVRAYFGLGTGY